MKNSFNAPDTVPLSELRSIVLGEGIATDIQPAEEYRKCGLGC